MSAVDNLTRRAQYTVRKLHPGTLVMLSFLGAVIAGALLLMLPFATVSGHIAPIDAVFTATSAVCVTGLVVVDTGTYYTMFGQIVILLLIQLGGLGIMTVSVAIFRFLGRTITFRSRMAMQDVFAATPRKDIYTVLKSVLLFTGITEAVGAALLFGHFVQYFAWPKALYSAVFHSVSAFCNAGFSLYSTSFMEWESSPLLNLTICALIVFGGLGFPVVHNLRNYVASKRKRKVAVRLSTQTKTVLWTTAFLIVFSMSVLWFVERTDAFNGYTLQERMLTTLFQSVTCRTAGFNTVDIGSLSNVTLLFMIFLMFVGASPGSTGGGIKTTTFAVIGSLALTRLRHRRWVNMFKRTVPTETITKAVSLVFMSLALIFVVFFLMLATAPTKVAGAEHGPFLSYIFEVVSAFGTVGLSMGATASLTFFGKTLIVITMLVGRVGVLTFSYVIAGAEPTGGIQRAEENIMIG